MADTHDTTRKLVLYRALYRFNRSFARIQYNIENLIGGRTVPEEFGNVWRDRLSETQSEINRRLTSILNEREAADTSRFGTINEQREENARRKKKR